MARFAILYLEGTTEDPRGGAHEAFLSEVTLAADDVDTFRVTDEGAINTFLAISSPLSQPATSRLRGDPPRDWKQRDPVEVDTRVVLGV